MKFRCLHIVVVLVGIFNVLELFATELLEEFKGLVRYVGVGTYHLLTPVQQLD